MGVREQGLSDLPNVSLMAKTYNLNKFGFVFVLKFSLYYLRQDYALEGSAQQPIETQNQAC